MNDLKEYITMCLDNNIKIPKRMDPQKQKIINNIIKEYYNKKLKYFNQN